MNNEIKITELNINDITLDWNNPRLLSYKNHIETFGHVTEEDTYLMLIYYMITEFYIEELLEKILNDWDYSLNLLSKELIYVFKESSGIYVVKEGNRRVTCLKIINNPKILKAVHEVAETKFKDKLHSFNKFEVKLNHIYDILDKHVLDNNFDVPVEISDNEIVLNRIIRDIHIERKERWNAIDVCLSDYNAVNKFICDGYGLDESISLTANELGYSETHYHINKRIKNIKENFEMAIFYKYFLELSKKKDKGSIYSEKIVDKFRPIVDTLRRRMTNCYNCKLVYKIKDKEVCSELLQNDILARTEVVDAYFETIMYILENNISHTKFTKQVSLENHVLKLIDVLDILSSSENPIKPKIKLKHYHGKFNGSDMSEFKLYLISNIKKITNSKGLDIDKQKVNIKVNGININEIDYTSLQGNIQVDYLYEESEYIETKVTASFEIYKESKLISKISDHANLKSFGYNRNININQNVAKYIEEINKLKKDIYPYIIATSFRPIFENCINEACKNYKFKNAGLPMIIKIIKELIKNNITDNPDLAFEYGFSKDNLINDFISIDYYKYKRIFDGFVHLNQVDITTGNIEEYLNVISRFIILIDIFIIEVGRKTRNV